ncbi:MAG: type II secretion system minor pseudopilin GspK [Polaromonas sp.]|uniref:type II secretion system minor pseudopilin GspK n=1 Tax=Polaromonas sp. TaxID=1869339 RepID=UPI0027354D1C|nr:type II secretion system minor pseudopilin GspK [Polaromonas sp.]MDP2818744.1 type II secretion system minor pseudopilin GspK [Polaromonas sp.]
MALLTAMLTVTLVATFAAAALWQQWRDVEVEAAERARVQSSWLLTGALDWARLILREDARSGGVDHLAEPWAVPLNDARLSSFLSADRNADDSGRDAFVSGQMVDLQSRLNVANLIDGNVVSDSGMAGFSRLFATLGLPPAELAMLAGQLLQASRNGNPVDHQGSAQAATDGVPAPLMPERVSELLWLGLTPASLNSLSPYITLLPTRTPVNLNTASAEVIHAITPGLEMADAQKLVSARQRSHFRALTDATQVSAGRPGQFNESLHTISSRFFEVRGSLRLNQTTLQERSLVQRDGLTVRTLWRHRSVVPDSQGRTQ